MSCSTSAFTCVEVGQVDLDRAARGEEEERDPHDRLAGGPADRDRVGRALEAVALDPRVELAGSFVAAVLWSTTTSPSGRAVEQVDVALEQPAADRGVQA